MPKISGQFTGNATMQTNISLPNAPEQEVSFADISGAQKVSDPNWKDTKVTFEFGSDLTRGSGLQRGFFVNEHPNGECDCGVAEAKVTTVNGQQILEGTWRYTHGTGSFDGISGGGTFKGRMKSPTEFEISWEGNYRLREAEVRRAA